MTGMGFAVISHCAQGDQSVILKDVYTIFAASSLSRNSIFQGKKCARSFFERDSILEKNPHLGRLSMAVSVSIKVLKHVHLMDNSQISDRQPW